jgi:hypothetical protein
MGEQQVDQCFKNHLVLEMFIYSPFNHQTWSLASESYIKRNILPQNSMKIFKCLDMELSNIYHLCSTMAASITEATDKTLLGIFLTYKC